MKGTSIMKDLLSYKTIRILNIAETIIFYEKNITYDDIQKLNDCSRKTVNDDLEYIYSSWNHLVDLNFENSRISSNNNSIYDLMSLKRHLFEKEVKIQFLISIFLNPNSDMPYHSKTLNYSESHLRRQIAAINIYLEKFSSSIFFDKDKAGYLIKSNNEMSTSFMISQLIKVSRKKYLMPPLDQDDFNSLSSYLGNPFEFIPDDEKLDMNTFFQVILIRKNQGFNINDSIKKLRKEHQNLLTQPDIFERVIKRYADVFNLQFVDKDVHLIKDIFLSLAFKSKLAPFEIDNFMNRFKYFYTSFKIENKNTSRMFELLLNEIKKDNKIDYIPYYYELAFLFYTHVHALRSFKSLKIAVSSDFGNFHSESLITSLLKHFPSHKFTRYVDNKQYDLVISTNDRLKNVEKDIIVKVSDYISVRDIEKIYNKIYIKLD